jgi:RNase P protein component
MASYWKTKTFKTKGAFDRWVERNRSRYQIREIFVNNAYGAEYKDLIRIGG